MAHGPHTHPLWGTSTSPLGKVCIATNVFVHGNTQRQEWPLGETGAITLEGWGIAKLGTWLDRLLCTMIIIKEEG